MFENIFDSTGAIVAVKPFTGGAEAAVNTGAAAVELKAAVTSKRHFITWFSLLNLTAGEYPIGILQDDAGTPIKHAHVATLQPIATSVGFRKVEFDPPLEIASGQAVDYALKTATGDCHAAIGGYVEV